MRTIANSNRQRNERQGKNGLKYFLSYKLLILVMGLCGVYALNLINGDIKKMNAGYRQLGRMKKIWKFR